MNRLELSQEIVLLENGQEFSDPITLTLTREEWIVLMQPATLQGFELNDAVRLMEKLADRGDPVAAAVITQLYHQLHVSNEALRKVTEAVMPQVAAAAKAEAERRRETLAEKVQREFN